MGQEGDAKTLPTIEESSSLIQQLEFRMYTRTQTWNEGDFFPSQE